MIFCVDVLLCVVIVCVLFLMKWFLFWVLMFLVNKRMFVFYLDGIIGEMVYLLIVWYEVNYEVCCSVIDDISIGYIRVGCWLF